MPGVLVVLLDAVQQVQVLAAPLQGRSVLLHAQAQLLALAVPLPLLQASLATLTINH
jgi:hypothetical protein